MKKTIGILSIILTLAVAAAGWFLLPDMVAMKYNTSGEVTKYMSKLGAVLIPALIGCIGGYTSLQGDKVNRFKGIVLTVLAIGIIVVMIFLNR